MYRKQSIRQLFSLLTLVFLGFASSTAQAFLFGGTGTSGSSTGWGSRAVCPFGEFPEDVAAKLTNPGLSLIHI